MTDLGIDDPVNISGMGLLVDLSGTNADFDPAALESEIIKGAGGNLHAPADPVRTPVDDFINSIAGPKTVTFDPAKEKAADPFGILSDDATLDSLLDEPVSQLSNLTQEQKKQAVIGDAFMQIGGSSPAMFNIEKERDEDDKARSLEQIASLLEILEDEGENIKSIPVVTAKSSKEEIEALLRHLRLKNDRKRCGLFAEECILLGVQGIEWMFDGQKKYFGQSPNMTGWSKTVQSKLRRMRHDTAAVVQNVMSEYGFGSGTRIIMELLPSAVLYSRMQKSQAGKVTDDEFLSATDSMRNYESAHKST